MANVAEERDIWGYMRRCYVEHCAPSANDLASVDKFLEYVRTRLEENPIQFVDFANGTVARFRNGDSALLSQALRIPFDDNSRSFSVTAPHVPSDSDAPPMQAVGEWNMADTFRR